MHLTKKSLPNKLADVFFINSFNDKETIFSLCVFGLYKIDLYSLRLI